MFIKLKKIKAEMGYTITGIIEIILNKSSIAKVEEKDFLHPCKYEGQTINICEIELINGETIEVVGKPVLDNGDLTFTET